VIPGADVQAVAVALGVVASLSLAAGSPRQQTTARAHLRIQDGCDEHCTFCATTLARGANRSRRVDELIVEATDLAESHPEIVITGIHIGTYGRDIGSSLGALVDALIESVPLVRFRLSSVEATEVDDRLGSLLTTDSSRLAPHLHAPLQSGSDTVLRRMGRHWYDSTRYQQAVRRLTDSCSVFGLSADVITGFPGETGEDHMATLRLVERLPFTALHVFPWSPRPGTSAVRLPDRVSGSLSRTRASELRSLASEKGAAYAAARTGGMCDVVVTERGKGLTEDYLSVAISDRTIPRRSRFRAALRNLDGELTAFPYD